MEKSPEEPVKNSSSDDTDDDDMPLWQLAAKSKTPKLPQKALLTKGISSNEESDEDMEDDAPLAMIVKKSEPLKSSLNQLYVENKINVRLIIFCNLCN